MACSATWTHKVVFGVYLRTMALHFKSGLSVERCGRITRRRVRGYFIMLVYDWIPACVDQDHRAIWWTQQRKRFRC